MSLFLGKIRAHSWVGEINPTDVLARAADYVFMALSELCAVSKEFIALSNQEHPAPGLRARHPGCNGSSLLFELSPKWTVPFSVVCGDGAPIVRVSRRSGARPGFRR
jgi:hypothetical protein